MLLQLGYKPIQTYLTHISQFSVQLFLEFGQVEVMLGLQKVRTRKKGMRK